MKTLPKRHRNVERDQLNNEELESMGWRVLEVWEHEVRKDPSAVARRIQKAVLIDKPKAT